MSSNATFEGPLGRLEPTDLIHVERYGLELDQIPKLPTPVVLGTLWFPEMDRPERVVDKMGNEKYWICRGGPPQSRPRGGHAYTLKPPGLRDYMSWYRFYNQGQEGACVGFAWSRAMSLLNRSRYNGRWLYKEAQKVDEWPGESYSGTSIRAGGDILRDVGHKMVLGPVDREPELRHGITENRWCRTVEDIHACLKTDINRGYVDFLNSWGENYPHIVRIPNEALDFLVFQRGGDATIITDRIKPWAGV